MTNAFKPSSSYDPEKFIDREKEIDQVISLLSQSLPRVRAFVFDGDRGVGKTWLSIHLHRTIFKNNIKGIHSWLFSLWSPGENYQPWGDKLQKNEWFTLENQRLSFDEFLRLIIDNLSITLPPNPVLENKVDAINAYIQSHVDERFVLILDSAYESDWKILEELEAHFLGKLLTLNNFFVIITGRGRPYPWKIPGLIEAIRFGLGKFSYEQLEKQLKKFGLSSVLSVKEIFNIGDGWPLFTEHLANSRDLSEALDVSVNIVFGVVPLRDRQQVQGYFEALCPLDGFGETEAALMVKSYGWNDSQGGRAICKKMNETRLVSWRNGRYEMNQSVQKILRLYMMTRKKEIWVQLQKTAYRYFELQANDRSMERFSEFFKKQMHSHEMALLDAGIKDL